MLLIFFIIFAYLLGSISSAILICRLMGLPDPRTQGSGNPGATNVLRVAGKKLAIIVLIGDVLKGVIPVALAKIAGVPTEYLAWVALAAFLGHLYPIFFGYKGGKGVATAIGGILVLSWPLGLTLIATWLFIAIVFRYSSLAAVIAAALAPVYGIWLLSAGNYFPVLVMCILLIFRHKDNLQKLWSGKEDKIGER